MSTADADVAGTVRVRPGARRRAQRGGPAQRERVFPQGKIDDGRECYRDPRNVKDVQDISFSRAT
ncbi:MAG: hypothetical protein FalmKO_32870 [Falsiruegeria mediterranea]